MDDNEVKYSSKIDEKNMAVRTTGRPTTIFYPETQHCHEDEDASTFKVYPMRWGVLATVALLNISNATIWINCSPVADKVANYYERDRTEAVNWFSLMYLFLAIPGSFFGPYCVNRFGLKAVIWTGASLNVAGAAVRVLATSGVFSDLDVQFAVSLSGQFFSGIAQSFILYLHTKVSQTWFSDEQRGVSTTILAISNPMGVVIAEVSVPYIVREKEDVPLNDKIWFGVACLAVLFALTLVRRAAPKTPPSYSAGATIDERPPYPKQLRMVFTTVPFLLLLLALGGGVAFTIVFATITQQILCPLGYSETFSGLINGMMILFGFVGSAFTGILLDRTKMYTEITMYLFGIAALCGIILFEFLLVPDRAVAIAVFASLFGLFGVSLFPVGLELAVETVYPAEESITTAMIFLSGQLQAIIIIAIVPVLAREKADTSLNVCDLVPGEVPQDYTVSILVVMAFLGTISCLSIAFFKTEYKRQNAKLQNARGNVTTQPQKS